jgi:hypothetical protein
MAKEAVSVFSGQVTDTAAYYNVFIGDHSAGVLFLTWTDYTYSDGLEGGYNVEDLDPATAQVVTGVPGSSAGGGGTQALEEDGTTTVAYAFDNLPGTWLQFGFYTSSGTATLTATLVAT